MSQATQSPVLPSPKSARELLDLYFLDMRSALLETASAFDRIERAGGGADALAADPRIGRLLKALDIIAHSRGDRAARMLAAFSEPSA
jgi:hypothetical protein